MKRIYLIFFILLSFGVRTVSGQDLFSFNVTGTDKIQTVEFSGQTEYQFTPADTAFNVLIRRPNGSTTIMKVPKDGKFKIIGRPRFALPVAGDILETRGYTYILAQVTDRAAAQGSVSHNITTDSSFLFLTAVKAATDESNSNMKFLISKVRKYNIDTNDVTTWNTVFALLDTMHGDLKNAKGKAQALLHARAILTKMDTSDSPAKAQGGSLLAGLAGMDVTKVADGFAQFMVKRTKQELNMAFFENFKEQLEKMPYLQSLFPATNKTLAAAGTDIYNYNRYLESLRQSFEEDLSNLLQNTEVWVEGNNQADPMLSLLETYIPNFRPMMLTSLYFTNQLMNRTHPGAIIANFDEGIIDEIGSFESPKGTAELKGVKPVKKTDKLNFTKIDSINFQVSGDFNVNVAECHCSKKGDRVILDNGYYGYELFGRVYTYQLTAPQRSYKEIEGIGPSVATDRLRYESMDEHSYKVRGGDLAVTDVARCSCVLSGDVVELNLNTVYFIRNNKVYVKTVTGEALKGIVPNPGVVLAYTPVRPHSFTVSGGGFAFKNKEYKIENGTITLPSDMLYNIPVGAAGVNIYKKETIPLIDSAKLTEGVKFMKLLSKSFRSDNDTTYWVRADDVYSKLLQNEKAMRYYLTLLYLEGRKNNINFFTDFIEAHTETIATTNAMQKSIKADLRALISKTNSINAAILRARDDARTTDKPDVKNIFELVNGTSDLLNTSLNIALHTSLAADTAQIAQVRKMLTLISKVSHIAQDISSRSYNAAISKSIELLASEFPKSADGETYNMNGDLFKTIEFLNKYGQFMASVVNAKNAGEVSDIIENTVLPPGSSRIKKETDFSISLNGYVGFEGGGEHYVVSRISYTGSTRIDHGYFGLSAPIGFAFNWGQRRGGQFKTPLEKQKSKPGMSHTLFLQLFDLGAIVAFRFGNDSSKVDAKIEMSKIFSPGVSYIYGIPKVPIAIKAGVQISPAITKLNAKDITYQPYTTVRYTLGVLVDIPFFNLYTSDKGIRVKKR